MRVSLLSVLTLFVLAIGHVIPAGAAERRPNIILIMTDNQGAWTLGCYGNRDIRTPNIDRLARGGMLFSHCYSSNAVCSPTRATWLTGLMPSQHGVHCYIAPSVQIGPKASSTLAEFRTLPEILAEAGYTCGLSGKWHLGRNLYPQEGFSFWVTKPGGSTSEFYDQEIIEDGKIHKVAEYQTDYWTARGIEFIEKNKDRPFFLFLAYNGPYGLSRMLLKEARNRHASYYADKELPSFPRHAMHPWLYNNRDYLNNPVSMRRYAAEISGVDDGVGRIVKALQDLKLDQDTLIVFTADQGLAGGQSGIWGMGDHTRPLSAFDSTMHVPLIFCWPGHIPRERRQDQLVSNYDFYPTLLTYLGMEDKIPARPARPGRNYASTLRGSDPAGDWDDTVFYEFETVRAIRTSHWKLVERLRGGPNELYDLERDPGELHNLTDLPAAAVEQTALHARLKAFFERYVDPRFDLSRGGTSKAGFLLSDSKPIVRAGAADGIFTMDATTMQRRGTNVRKGPDLWTMVGWKQGSDRAVWSVRGVRAGPFRVEAAWAQPGSKTALPQPAPVLEIDGKPMEGNWVPQRGGPVDGNAASRFSFGPFQLGAGDHEFSFGPAIKPAVPWLALRSLKLVPIGKGKPVAHAAETLEQEGPAVESKYLRLVLRKDLKAVAHLIDKRTGRDYATDQRRPTGLYLLHFGRALDQGRRVSSTSVVSREVTPREDGLTLTFEHKGTHPARVECAIRATPREPMIHWQITVQNLSNQLLCAIDYPQLACPLQLGENVDDDAILYPQSEGILLCQPKVRMPIGATVAKEYPGVASAQLMYFHDASGGLYFAVHDGDGHSKTPLVVRNRDDITLSWRHMLPGVKLARSSLSYDIVTTVAGGSWQEGADIYRDWAAKNAPWCGRKLRQANVPRWLLRSNAFLNYTVTIEGPFYPAARADRVFQSYQDFLATPVVACAFNWEKNGTWIGPDYFPPNGGVEYYTDLAEKLAGRDSHMHVFTSGFRWGVRKVASEQPGPHGRKYRKYTSYNGQRDYYQRGVSSTVMDQRGSRVMKRPPWADNYLLCVGSETARDILGECFQTIYDYGIAGVDLDQNIGAGAPDCFNSSHGHPPGSGRWKFKAMSEFLNGVRNAAGKKHADAFLGVEEPCEAFIPYVDIVHGRAFTDTVWPASGPGALSIPLYIYLYHDYQLTYAGWIDRNFSPAGDVRKGICRATIFGMQLGVRIDQGDFHYTESDPAEALVMLRDSARLIDCCRDYLLLGRMLHEPLIEDSPMMPRSTDTQHPEIPMAWPVVQATAWQSADGNVCYALANMSAEPQLVTLRLSAHGMNDAAVQLSRINADSRQPLRKDVRLPLRLPVQLAAWEVCCIEQTL